MGRELRKGQQAATDASLRGVEKGGAGLLADGSVRGRHEHTSERSAACTRKTWSRRGSRGLAR